MSLYVLQEAEQQRLEMEMQKRRDRIEKWRAERKKNTTLTPINVAPPTKKWSLEDDDDDDDEPMETQNSGGSDEVDPLDAYMASVNEEVSKMKKEKVVPKNNEGVSSHGNSTIRPSKS